MAVFERRYLLIPLSISGTPGLAVATYVGLTPR